MGGGAEAEVRGGENKQKGAGSMGGSWRWGGRSGGGRGKDGRVVEQNRSVRTRTWESSTKGRMGKDKSEGGRERMGGEN